MTLSVKPVKREGGLPPLYQYDNLADLIRDLRTPASEHASYQSSQGGSMGFSWDFGADMDDALDLAENGWPDGRENVEVLAAALKERIERDGLLEYAMPVISSSVAGPMVNVPAYIAGQPEAMFTWEHQPTLGPAVSVVINASAASDVPAAHYATRGAAVCALVDTLEASGRRCELTWVYSTYHNYTKDGGRGEVRVTLKRPEEPLQTDIVAFMYGHPANLRRLGFATAEHVHFGSGKTEGYVDLNGAAPVGDHGDLYLPRLDGREYQWDSEGGALDWVEQHLKAFGVAFTEEQ